MEYIEYCPVERTQNWELMIILSPVVHQASTSWRINSTR